MVEPAYMQHARCVFVRWQTSIGVQEFILYIAVSFKRAFHVRQFVPFTYELDLNVVDSLTGNICSDDEIHAKPPIYLSNKDYPLPRTGASNCECMVVKNPTYTTLKLTAIEMHIFDSRCSMSLVIETGDGEEISFPCNYKLEGYRKWKDLSSENTTFTLSNSQQQGDAYLWMEISCKENIRIFSSLIVCFSILPSDSMYFRKHFVLQLLYITIINNTVF